MTEPTGLTGQESDNFNSISVGDAPLKKLKLTLKLNSSSVSSSSASSILASSTTASPIKATSSNETTKPSVPPVTAVAEMASVSIDLPSGLGNVKGRGRPKKTAASKTATSSSISTVSEEITKESVKESNSAASEYSADLKSFVTVMKTFQPRKWSLKRPITLELKNLGGHEISLPNGLWCTFTGELGSAHLTAIATTTNPNNSNTTAIPNQEEFPAFEATCQCGKAFTDRSKFRKHVRIHEKAKNANKEETVDVVDNGHTTDNTTVIIPTIPTISLKLKLKPQ